MAACSAGDREEVAALLRQGADINHANIDGLTALHQVGKLTLLSQLFTAVSPALCQLIWRKPSLNYLRRVNVSPALIVTVRRY